MATAWGPQITYGEQTAGISPTTDTETVVATATVASTGETIDKVWLTGWVTVEAPTDCTTVLVVLYRGPGVTGTQLIAAPFTIDQTVTPDSSVAVSWVDEVGPDTQGQEYNLTVKFVGASADGTIDASSLVAVAF